MKLTISEESQIGLRGESNNLLMAGIDQKSHDQMYGNMSAYVHVALSDLFCHLRVQLQVQLLKHHCKGDLHRSSVI